MTRRIAITILLTVWSAIIIAGSTAWGVAYHVMLKQLDQTVLDTAVDGAVRSGGTGSSARERIAQAIKVVAHPEVIERRFISLPQGELRQLRLRIADGSTPVFALPADNFRLTLNVLATSLAGCGLVAGIGAMLVARRLARIALRPLQHTADVIGAIDESKLDHRISTNELPVELQPMASRCNELLERLGEAFEQRRRFLADASHELRTPVAALITTMEIALRRPREAPELAETLQTCLNEARHMRALVQALLRQVRAEGAVSDAGLEDIDAGQMLKECADLADSLAFEKQVTVVRTVKGLVPIRAEVGRLRSVVLNLMSNAIEYSPPGATVEVSATNSDNSEAEIAIRDNGPGIAPEHLPHIFQPFYRASQHRESEGHLGLGLFLVKSHVKAMGGDCRVESLLGSGTTFRVRLPSSVAALATSGGR
jgi:signal transduction histidine kinase